MNTKPIKVLIGDDNDDYGRSCAAALRQEGLQVNICPKDGRTVLHTICCTVPDVVIADTVMPHYDAIALLEKCQLLERRPVFIITSPYKTPWVEQQVLKYDDTYFLYRPFLIPALVKRIYMLLEKSSSSAQTFEDYVGSIERAITDMLRQLGVPAHIKGYYYLRSSILAACQNPRLLESMKRNLYPVVAETYHTTVTCVEQSIRRAVFLSWQHTNPNVIREIFGDSAESFQERPTNSVFISALADKLTLQYQRQAMAI